MSPKCASCIEELEFDNASVMPYPPNVVGVFTTLLQSREVIQDGSAYEPDVNTIFAVVIPFTCVADSEPPVNVAPLIVPAQAKFPLELVTVHPVDPEPPPI